jgi:nicotinamide-nucleotide amidase
VNDLSLDAPVEAQAQAVVSALKSRGMTIVTAESCTAGALAAVLSRANGAGEVLDGGFITYTKAHKTAALGVSPDLLAEKGAVNAEVVRQLAGGALDHSRASFAIAISGVLGPEKDEDGNPVGLVYFCTQARGETPRVTREEFGCRPRDTMLDAVIGRALALIESGLRSSSWRESHGHP